MSTFIACGYDIAWNFDHLRALALVPTRKRGAVAQLGERLNGIQEVDGSIPFGSTSSVETLDRVQEGIRDLAFYRRLAPISECPTMRSAFLGPRRLCMRNSPSFGASASSSRYCCGTGVSGPPTMSCVLPWILLLPNVKICAARPTRRTPMSLFTRTVFEIRAIALPPVE